MTQKLSPNLPAAARKQVLAANRLLAEMNQTPAEAAAAAAATAAAAGAPLDDPNAPPDLPNVGTAPPADAQPVVVTPPADAQAVAPTDEDTWKAKYKALQGKYNKEVPELRSRLDTMQDIVNRVATQPPVAAAPVAATVPPTQEETLLSMGVTQKEIDDYGEDLINLMSRVSQRASTAELTELRKKVADMEAQVAPTLQRSAAQARQAVFDALAAQIGEDWKDVNNSDEFLAWLQVRDIFSNLTRHEGLIKAFEANDATRVVGIFKAYVEGKTPTAPTSQGPAVSRETLVAPGRGRGATGEAPGASTSARIWSEQEISDFYSRARQKKVPADEYTRTQAEISKAIAEGRVRVARSTQHHLNN